MGHARAYPPPIDRCPRGMLAHLLRRFHVGTIAIRTGSPHDEDPWEWCCGFYPGSGEHQNGTAATFDQARSDFEAAWKVFLANRTEADFQAWRDQRDWTARKYALWDAGKRLPPNEWE